MKSIYARQIKKVEKQEQKLLNKKENQERREKIEPIQAKIAEKIPPKLMGVLEEAFFKGFQLVFEKGSPWIERSFNKGKIQLEYDVNNYAADKLGTRKQLRKMDHRANRSRRLNTGLAVIEGAGLGLLGLGLPDIPLFTAMLLKTVYEIAVSYGFDYEKQDERIYVLALINGAIAKGGKQKVLDGRLEEITARLENDVPLAENLKEKMKETSTNLAEAMLLGKYIQGLPLVGIYGGLLNYNLMTRVSRYAKLKYKKRYLRKKI
ncbi:MAG TPA: EcsC family protein [Peptococcaceae bacterium]|nr:EcsC family protein [Peptococcaceae bacterium]